MQKVYPCLWFNNNAEEAVNFYTSVFKNSKINAVSRYGDAMPVLAGSVMTMIFEIEGQKFMALNGGPEFQFNEAVSFVIDCQSQQEVDDLWSKLTADGGEESMCGWVKDKFGLSWQVVPTRLGELMSDPDPEKARRVTEAMLKMRKLDIVELERAYAGR